MRWPRTLRDWVLRRAPERLGAVESVIPMNILFSSVERRGPYPLLRRATLRHSHEVGLGIQLPCTEALIELTRIGSLLSVRKALIYLSSLHPHPWRAGCHCLPVRNRTKRKEGKNQPASEKRSSFRVYSIYIYEDYTKCQALLLGVAIGIMKQTQRSLVQGRKSGLLTPSCFFFLQVLEYTGIKQGAVSFNLGRIPKDFLEICKVKNNIMD